MKNILNKKQTIYFIEGISGIGKSTYIKKQSKLLCGLNEKCEIIHGDRLKPSFFFRNASSNSCDNANYSIWKNIKPFNNCKVKIQMPFSNLHNSLQIL